MRELQIGLYSFEELEERAQLVALKWRKSGDAQCEFLKDGTHWQGNVQPVPFAKKGRAFGEVSVHRDNGQIFFPAKHFPTVIEAEMFMCRLIDAITFSRKVIGDPL